MEDVTRNSLGYFGGYRDYAGEAHATSYAVERYRPWLHLFTIHSWGPTSGPPDLGFGLISNDKMGLAAFNASLLYNTDERAFGVQTGGTYSRFYTALDVSFTDRHRRLDFVDHEDNWNESTADAGFHVPLNLSRGYYFTGMSFGAGVESVRLMGHGLVPLAYGIGIRRARQMSARDLAPAWAQLLRLTYRQSPWHGFYTANYLSADGRFALPGLAPHHSLQLEGGYERQNGNYFFSSQVLFPRGYRAVTGRDLTKFSASYALPLFYPDWALGQLAYIKRVSGNVFYDYGKVANQLYRSTGLELLFDLGVLHFPDSLRAGVRYAWLLDFRSSRVQPFIAYYW